MHLPAVRKLGYRPDPPKAPGEAPDRRAKARLGSGPIPDHESASHLVLSVLDQGGLSSCVANAVCQAVRAAQFKALGIPCELGSRLFLYYFARAYLKETAVDQGTFIRLAFQTLNKFGLPPESAFPYTDQDSRYQDMPGISAVRLAYDQRAPTTYLRIDEVGDARVDAVRRAIAQGFLVVLGTSVSDMFCNNQLSSEPVMPPIGLKIAGDHAMAVTAYDFRGSKPYFELVNSWGKNWGNSDSPGFWKMAPEYLTWANTNDLWIAERTPTFIADTVPPAPAPSAV